MFLQTPVSFMQAFSVSLSLFKYLTLSTIITSSECPSGSIRSRIKLSGHLPPALKHEGERFGDYSENNRPSLLLCSSNTGGCLFWQPCPGSERPDVMPAPSHCSPGAAGQRQGKHMTSVLCGTEPTQWPESTAPVGPVIAQGGESRRIETRDRERKETERRTER